MIYSVAKRAPRISLISAVVVELSYRGHRALLACIPVPVIHRKSNEAEDRHPQHLPIHIPVRAALFTHTHTHTHTRVRERERERGRGRERERVRERVCVCERESE